MNSEELDLIALSEDSAIVRVQSIDRLDMGHWIVLWAWASICGGGVTIFDCDRRLDIDENQARAIADNYLRVAAV